MTAFSVTVSADLTTSGVTDVTALSYLNPLRSVATVTLNASQLHYDNFLTTSYLSLTGSSGTNNLVILVDVTNWIDGASFGLTNWSNADRISFLGDAQENRVFGTLRADTIRGGAGNDVLIGLGGNDKLYGDEGDDQLALREGLVDGGAGNDILTLELVGLPALSLNIADGGGGRLMGGVRISGIEGLVLTGGNEADTVVGGFLADTIFAGDGADQISTGLGRDYVKGGDGDDVLQGGGDGDWLWGEDGDDSLQGGAGGDQISGGIGTDTLTGGQGADRFVFALAEDSTLAFGIDTITDFRHGVDKIDLIALAMGGTYRPLFYIGETEFGFPSGYYGEVRWYQDATTTHIEVQGPSGEMQIDLTGLVNLTRDDFIL